MLRGRAQDDEESTAEYVELTRRASLGTSWFFRMFGTRQGQTFHERQAETGDFADPRTVRVARPHEEDCLEAQRLLAKLAPLDPDFATASSTRAELMAAIAAAATTAELDLAAQQASEALPKIARDYVVRATAIARQLGLPIDVPSLSQLGRWAAMARRATDTPEDAARELDALDDAACAIADAIARRTAG